VVIIPPSNTFLRTPRKRGLFLCVFPIKKDSFSGVLAYKLVRVSGKVFFDYYWNYISPKLSVLSPVDENDFVFFVNLIVKW